jgi:hypothetical protein
MGLAMDQPEPAMPALTMELVPGSRIRDQSRGVFDHRANAQAALSAPDPLFYKKFD